MWTDVLERVPADMGQLLLGLQTLHGAGKDAKASGSVLRAPIEEQLHAQADPKEWDPRTDRRDDGLVEAALSESSNCRRRGTHPGKDDGACLGQILGGGGDPAGGVEPRQRILHTAQVAGTVVDERDHFVLAIRPRSAGSTTHAWRSARARALKVASARWWSSRPEAVTSTVTPLRSAKGSRKWGTRAARSEPSTTPPTPTSNTPTP